MRWIPLLGAAALLGSLGCGSLNTDPNIFVELVSVTDFTVNVVEKGPLVTELTGGFTLTLHLGARASGPGEVNVQGFELISGDKNTIIVGSLPLVAKDATLPIEVEPDSDEVVTLEIDAKELAPDDGQKLCSFGKVLYRGSISDSLRGGTVPVESPEPVEVTGCMP
jgi:hypothetical protein